MEKFKRYYVTSYQKAVLYALKKQIDSLIPEKYFLPISKLTDAVSDLRKQKAPFSFPDLIYIVDSLIASLDHVKNNLIVIKKWLKRKWDEEDIDFEEEGKSDEQR